MGAVLLPATHERVEVGDIEEHPSTDLNSGQVRSNLAVEVARAHSAALRALLRVEIARLIGLAHGGDSWGVLAVLFGAIETGAESRYKGGQNAQGRGLVLWSELE